MKTTSLFVALGASFALAAPLEKEKRADYAIHNEHPVPEGWARLSKPDPVCSLISGQ